MLDYDVFASRGDIFRDRGKGGPAARLALPLDRGCATRSAWAGLAKGGGG